MTEIEILEIFKTDYKELFPKLRESSAVIEAPQGTGREVVLSIVLAIKEEKITLLCGIVGQSYPKQLREKGLVMLEASKYGQIGYPVIIAPFISELGKQTCKKIGIGFFDLSGNAYIDINSFYMEIEGKPNKFKTKRELATLFSPKAERALRFHLLKTWPEGKWAGTYRDIATEVSISLGQVVKVNKKLDELGFWIEESKGLKTLDITKLLNTWRENYNFEKNIRVSLYSMENTPKIEEQIAEFCSKRNISYAFTLFSGANRIAPFTRYNMASSYFSGNVDELKKALDLKEVSSGANVIILKPYDEGVYYGVQDVKSLKVVSPVQLYLDLYNYKGRGREQAEFLREQVLKY